MPVLGEAILKAFSHTQSCKAASVRAPSESLGCGAVPYPWVQCLFGIFQKKGRKFLDITEKSKKKKTKNYSWKQIRTKSVQFLPIFPSLSSLPNPGSRSSSISSLEKYSFSLCFYFTAGNNWCVALSPLPQVDFCPLLLTKERKKAKVSHKFWYEVST